MATAGPWACAADYKAAVEALGKSLQLRRGGEAFDYFPLAMAHQQLGDKVQACHCYGHAVVWMASNKQFIANHKNVAYEGGGIYNAGTLTVSNTFN